MARTKAKTGDEPDRPDYVLPDRELVVVAEPSARLRAGRGEVQAAPGTETAALNALLAEEGVALEPLFGASEERTRAAGEALSGIGGAEVPDLSIYYRVRAEDERLEDLAESLAKLPGIAQAYVKPAAEPAVPQLEDEVLERRTSAAADTPPVTPDFTAGQGYLRGPRRRRRASTPATVAGRPRRRHRHHRHRGRLALRPRGPRAEPGRRRRRHADRRPAWRNHGTAVVGEFGGDVTASASPASRPDAAGAGDLDLRQLLGRGDPPAPRRCSAPATSSCIELHRPGPRFNFQVRNDQRGYIAMEWWPDDFAAIQFADREGRDRGRGRRQRRREPGRRRLRHAGRRFPGDLEQPVQPEQPDSLAVVVGAGAPPPGTHGHDHGPDRSRLDFSNYGARVDAQGWGREVTTTATATCRAAHENLWYTDTFSGTSSASPDRGRCLACLQGILAGRRPDAADAGRGDPGAPHHRLAAAGRARAGPPPSASAGARTSGRPWRA